MGNILLSFAFTEEVGNGKEDPKHGTLCFFCGDSAFLQNRDSSKSKVAWFFTVLMKLSWQDLNQSSSLGPSFYSKLLPITTKRVDVYRVLAGYRTKKDNCFKIESYIIHIFMRLLSEIRLPSNTLHAFANTCRA